MFIVYFLEPAEYEDCQLISVMLYLALYLFADVYNESPCSLLMGSKQLKISLNDYLRGIKLILRERTDKPLDLNIKKLFF